jgi:hypothetical protein
MGHSINCRYRPAIAFLFPPRNSCDQCVASRWDPLTVQGLWGNSRSNIAKKRPTLREHYENERNPRKLSMTGGEFSAPSLYISILKYICCMLLILFSHLTNATILKYRSSILALVFRTHSPHREEICDDGCQGVPYLPIWPQTARSKSIPSTPGHPLYFRRVEVETVRFGFPCSRLRQQVVETPIMDAALSVGYFVR